MIAIGYPNGANILASLLFHNEDALEGAILHHPMVARKGIKLSNLAEKENFHWRRKNDPICSLEESREL